jgi:hypothetical protein
MNLSRIVLEKNYDLVKELFLFAEGWCILRNEVSASLGYTCNMKFVR